MNSIAVTHQPISRDVIMKEIANQAAAVRRTFEAHETKRKQTSSATAAAAHHMASLNRKRKFENSLIIRATAAANNNNAAEPDHVWMKTSNTFHSPIASFTRPEKKHVVSVGESINNSSSLNQETMDPRISDGIILKGSPHDITVSYNDVVCGKGRTTSTLVGNQRYKVWIDLHKGAFAKAFDEYHRRKIACSIVDAVATSVPQGRFISLDVHSGLWYDLGYARAVGITLEALMDETGMTRNHGMVAHPCGVRPANVPRTLVSRAA
eukprot:CAMPEP_0196144178 /NCGR_PEP_ID=MMETSP0910-20130528/15413_1 /TAXON_ID=49265 /ORGANISM="Thalassiosira rotula, Strain GSO102" /LENGTH=265 /DNA_ID=CAMNT_0041405773 /DNA_START=25 /DNA_END=822 /DNA_ORIENTATION=+